MGWPLSFSLSLYHLGVHAPSWCCVGKLDRLANDDIAGSDGGYMNRKGLILSWNPSSMPSQERLQSVCLNPDMHSFLPLVEFLELESSLIDPDLPWNNTQPVWRSRTCDGFIMCAWMIIFSRTHVCVCPGFLNLESLNPFCFHVSECIVFVEVSVSNWLLNKCGSSNCIRMLVAGASL